MYGKGYLRASSASEQGLPQGDLSAGAVIHFLNIVFLLIVLYEDRFEVLFSGCKEPEPNLL